MQVTTQVCRRAPKALYYTCTYKSGCHTWLAPTLGTKAAATANIERAEFKVVYLAALSIAPLELKTICDIFAAASCFQMDNKENKGNPFS